MNAAVSDLINQLLNPWAEPIEVAVPLASKLSIGVAMLRVVGRTQPLASAALLLAVLETLRVSPTPRRGLWRLETAALALLPK